MVNTFSVLLRAEIIQGGNAFAFFNQCDSRSYLVYYHFDQDVFNILLLHESSKKYLIKLSCPKLPLFPFTSLCVGEAVGRIKQKWRLARTLYVAL